MGADDILVGTICGAAESAGEPAATAKIERRSWLGYADRERVCAVDGPVFDWRHEP